MPVTTEKRTRNTKRGPALAIAGGLVLVLLSLPLLLTLFSEGVSLGGHGVHASWNGFPSAVGEGFWFLTGSGNRNNSPSRSTVFGWGENSYILTVW